MGGESNRLAPPLFVIPPFPHARFGPLMRPAPSGAAEFQDVAVDELIALAAANRIGGTYWGSQPSLPAEPYTLARTADAASLLRELEPLPAGQSVVVWLLPDQPPPSRSDDKLKIVTGECDPWHLLGGAEQVYCDADDELALIASLAGVPVHCIGKGRFEMLDKRSSGKSFIRNIFLAEFLQPYRFISPYTNQAIEPAKAIELCAFWRSVIDSNRDTGSALGFAPWKRPTVAPLLWAGSGPVPFNAPPEPGKPLAIWRSRLSARELGVLARGGNALLEVEDGFIRSVGLGADCVPPLSIVIDRLGIYFDPGRESDLERLLIDGDFSSELLARARDIRELIVSQGVSKYELAASSPDPRDIVRGSILVPGQVEDDRSVLLGGGEVQTNTELLRRVRASSPDAFIIYKPHPDVEAGHRVGRIPEELCLELADEIVRDQPISALFDQVEQVHVNTSLAGFEALLRGKSVTTYGVPFYAGWGLTRDLGKVPSRRSVRRTIDELVAAALLIYPRYVDPLTGLPCPPEVLIDRLTQRSTAPANGLLVRLRRLQGRLKRHIGILRDKLA